MLKETIKCSQAGEQCIFARLDSGLEIYICEKKEFGTNYAVFGTKYGSVDTEFSVDGGETVKVPAGIAHFLEHKLFEGEDGDAFDKYAVTGASANAYTSFDRTCYLFSCADRFDDNMDILLDFVSSPYFTDNTVKKEQGIIGQEIKMYEDVPDWRVLFNLFRAMYHNNPVKIEIAGTVESISKITPELLYKCYNTFYSPSNMYICVCGNVDAETLIKKIELKTGNPTPVQILKSTFNEPYSIKQPYIEESMAVTMPLFIVGIKENAENPHRSVKDVVTADVLLEYVCGRASDMYDALIKKKLINDNFGAEYFYGHGYGALIFEGESDNPEKVKQAIINEFRKIKGNGIDEKIFRTVIRKMTGNEMLNFNDTETAASMFIDCAVNGWGPYDYINTLSSVTSEDVFERVNGIDLDNTVLSVIKPIK